MIRAQPTKVSDTPLQPLLENPNVTIKNSDETVIRLEEYGVEIHESEYGCEVVSEHHDPIRGGHRSLFNVALAILEECERVGDWLVGRDPMEEFGLSKDRVRDYTDIEHDIYEAYKAEKERQRAARHPNSGGDILPANPTEEYPWIRPFDRMPVYAYKSLRKADCPICGAYGRQSDYEDSISCKSHGGFLYINLRNKENWVRRDDSKYRNQLIKSGRRGYSPDKMLIVRDGELVTVSPNMGGDVKPDDVRRHGYNMPKGPNGRYPGGYGHLWEARITEPEITLKSSYKSDEYHIGDCIIFSRHEVLASKYPDESIRLSEKPWADGIQFHEGMDDYYQKLTLDTTHYKSLNEFERELQNPTDSILPQNTAISSDD